MGALKGGIEIKMVEAPGFEPGLPDPESGVLPLHHASTESLLINTSTGF